METAAKKARRIIVIINITLILLILLTCTATAIATQNQSKSDHLTYSEEQPEQVSIAVILARTSDTGPRFNHNAEYYRKITSNLTSYYLENTYGTVNISTTIFNDTYGRWFTLAGSSNYYGGDRPDGGGYPIAGKYTIDEEDHSTEFAWDAIKTADWLIDYDQYDMIVAVHTENSSQMGGDPDLITTQAIPVTLSTSGSYSLKSDGAHDVARNWIIVAENDPLGMWAHEVGHLLRRALEKDAFPENDYTNVLPDRYGDGVGIGKWGVMGMGAWLGHPLGTHPDHMCSHSKWLLGLLGYQNVSHTTIWVNSLETSHAGDNITRYNLRDGSYYILEVRNSNQQYSHWDTSIRIPSRHESALVVYHVKPISGTNEDVNVAGVLAPVGTFGAPDTYVDVGNGVAFTALDEIERNTSDGVVFEIQVRISTPDQLDLEHSITYPDDNSPGTLLKTEWGWI